MVTNKKLNIDKCVVNEHDVLLDEERRNVLIQIGCDIFELKHVRQIKYAFELKPILDSHKYNIQLLKGE